VTLAAGQTQGHVPGRRYRIPAGLGEMNHENLLSVLAWVPAGWRAAGRLQVKNAEHELACRLDLHLGGTRPDGSPCILITSSWVIDSRWVTSRWIPGLDRRIVMTCSCSLQPDM
jgi:hypothetical protein